MPTETAPPRNPALYGLALALFAVQILLAGRYGIFRDELYYVACGKHLAVGYVDHPPLVAVMARLSTELFGHSLYGLRLWPAVCAGATVLLTGELARQLGGRGFAQVVAATCVIVAPEMLGTCHYLSMNCVLPVAWTAAAMFALRGVRAGDVKAWIYFGIACGIGLMAKHSTLVFGIGLGVGMVATDARTRLASRGPWLGLVVAALIFAPNLVWEAHTSWPTLEFMHNAQADKMAHFGPLTFLVTVVLGMMPLSLPIWLAGTYGLLRSTHMRAGRFLGVGFVVMFAIVVLANGKPYYLVPAFPIVWAAGAVAIERVIIRRAARIAVVAMLVITGVAIAPMALPILDESTFIRYAAAIGVGEPASENHEPGLLPPFHADQHGWEAMARKVALAYASLSPSEQRHATIFGGNYAEAAAIDFYGERWDLPSAWSGHNAYFTWGPPDLGRSEVLIAVGGFTCEDWSALYGRIVMFDQTDDPYAMPYEKHIPICILRAPKRTLYEIWFGRRQFL